jgi:hypothetical protein
VDENKKRKRTYKLILKINKTDLGEVQIALTPFYPLGLLLEPREPAKLSSI